MSATQVKHPTARNGGTGRFRHLWPALACIGAVTSVTLVLVCLAYQFRPAYFIDVGTEQDKPFNQNFNAREPNPVSQGYTGPDYRWSGDESTLFLPGIGAQTLNLTLNVQQSANPNPQLSVTVNGHDVPAQQVALPDPAFHQLHISVPQDWFTSGDLNITLHAKAFQPPKDARHLGVVVDWLRVEPAQTGFAPGVTPPIDRVLALTALVLVLTAMLLSFGLPARFAALAGLAGALGVCVWLVQDRLSLTVFPIWRLLPPLLCLWLVAWALVRFGPRLLARFGLRASSIEFGIVGAIFILAFVVLYGGLIHPQFTTSDIGLHAHKIQQVGAGSLFFTEPLPNGQVTPYPPGYYVLLQPFAALTDGSDLALGNLLLLSSALLQCSGVYLVFFLSTLLPFGNATPNWAGIIAAAFYAANRYPFIIFSQGNHSNIYGAWVFLLFLCALAACMRAIARTHSHDETRDSLSRVKHSLPFLLPGVLLFAVFTSHYGTFLFSNVFVAGTIGVLALLRYWRNALYLLATYVCALLLAFGLYYSHFLSFMFGQSGGKKATPPGFDTFANNFWRDVRDNFGFVALAALVGIWLWLRETQFSQQKGVDGEKKQDAVVRLLLLVLGLVCLAFAIATHALPQESRYELYAAPFVALAAGTALARFRPQERLGLLIAGAIFLFQFGLTLLFWLDRLPYYFGR